MLHISISLMYLTLVPFTQKHQTCKPADWFCRYTITGFHIVASPGSLELVVVILAQVDCREENISNSGSKTRQHLLNTNLTHLSNFLFCNKTSYLLLYGALRIKVDASKQHSAK